MSTKLDIDYLAELSKLQIAPSEHDHYEKDLNSILEMVEQLQKVDTKEVEPMAHPLDLAQRLREDTVTEVDSRERFQTIAPETQDGLYLVPKVIEGE